MRDWHGIWRRGSGLQTSDEQLWSGEVLSQLERMPLEGLDPEALWKLGELHGYEGADRLERGALGWGV